MDYKRLSIDFKSTGRLQLKRPLISKAVGIKGDYRPRVIDATAGLGRDSLTLAREGCEVLMIERSPVLFDLLNDALVRLDDPTLKLSLLQGDAIKIIEQITFNPDVIYLDPMYPHSSKSALPKKELVILRELVGEDLDAPALLDAALAVAKKRVVVKRPHRAEILGEKKPDIVYKSKLVRFDVYLTQ